MLKYLMIYAGSVLMVINIIFYIRFERRIKGIGNWEKERRVLYIPIILLILFLLGYLSVALFGDPDMIMAGILLGGSIFVFVMILLIRKATERIEKAEELKYALRSARQASEAKSMFLSNMSHDIRTPLNAIVGFTELAAREGVSPEEMRGYIKKIGDSGKNLMELINDVLEMSRIESGRMELDEAPADIREPLKDISDMFSPGMNEKNIIFTADHDNVRDFMVICDRTRVFRILLNLVSNAYKFTPEGGSVSVTLEQKDGGTEGYSDYIFRVKDTGIGMTEEFAEKVFEAFERERTSTVSGIQGTGLGMAITKSIVDMMNGRIEVATSPGKGTEFTVILPLKKAEGCTEIADGGDPETEVEDINGKRVLLAEDVEMNRLLAGAVLEHMGCVVEMAENGQQAVEMVKNSAPGYYDAVLMDVQMPVMDGYTATREIRNLEDEARSEIPVIAVTANAFAEDVKKSEEAGMNGHVSKPIDGKALEREIKRVIGNAGKN